MVEEAGESVRIGGGNVRTQFAPGATLARISSFQQSLSSLFPGCMEREIDGASAEAQNQCIGECMKCCEPGFKQGSGNRNQRYRQRLSGDGHYQLWADRLIGSALIDHRDTISLTGILRSGLRRGKVGLLCFPFNVETTATPALSCSSWPCSSLFAVASWGCPSFCDTS